MSAMPHEVRQKILEFYYSPSLLSHQNTEDSWVHLLPVTMWMYRSVNYKLNYCY